MLNRIFPGGIKTRNKLLLAYLGLSIPLLVFTSLAVLSIVKHSIEQNIDSQLHHATDSIVSLVRGTASASIKNYLRAVAEKTWTSPPRCSPASTTMCLPCPAAKRLWHSSGKIPSI